MAAALADVAIKAPIVPVVANVVASAVTDPDEIRKLLVQQVTGTVRWRECVGYLAANGITDVFEIGSGKVLAGLAKRIEKSLEAASLGTPADIDAAIEKLA
jgi:[acyl-carrier-protein] S-malonyltransferase